MEIPIRNAVNSVSKRFTSASQTGSLKFAGETRDAVANLCPTAEEARITCAIADAGAMLQT